MVRRWLKMPGCALMLFAVVGGGAFAEMSERETILVERIEELERRLAELESRMAGASVTETPSAEPAEVEEPKPEKLEGVVISPVWRNGLQFQSEDGGFAMKVGGRLQLDYAFIDQSRDLRRVFGKDHDAGEFRRARIDITGRMYDDFTYRMAYDFAGDGSGKFRDVWMRLGGIPYVGNVTVGHFREPMGLEILTNSNYLTFMERGLPAALIPARNLGAMLHNGLFDDRLTWAVGGFKETGDFPGRRDAASGYAVTGRVTGLPWHMDKGRRMLHLGVAYSYRNPKGDVVGYSTRPEANLAGRYLDTERYPGFRLRDVRMNREDLWALETAWVHGPFSLQGEYVNDRAKTKWGGNATFSGYYGEASYFLTGENRAFNPASATFGRVAPRRNFSLSGDRGWGAWQLALRYSSLDLNSGIIRGGEERNWTLGLNWHLNPNMRVFWNYVMADIDHDLYSGRVNVLQTRMQIEF